MVNILVNNGNVDILYSGNAGIIEFIIIIKYSVL